MAIHDILTFCIIGDWKATILSSERRGDFDDVEIRAPMRCRSLASWASSSPNALLAVISRGSGNTLTFAHLRIPSDPICGSDGNTQVLQ